MTTDKTFSSWERRFRSSELGGLALKSLQDLRRWDEQRFSFLELHVLEACHAAHVYQKSGDVHKQVRVKDAEISRDQSKLIRQAVGDANRLAQFLRKYEVQVQFPLAFCGHHFVDDDSAGATPLRIARVLEDMASYLDEGGAIAKSGNFMHRHSVGCLFFDRPVDEWPRLIDGAATPLMFNLVFLFRRWTGEPGPQSFARWSIGERMPTTGKPRYKVAAQFVDATLGPQLNSAEGRLKALLSRHRNSIGIRGWEIQKQ